MKNFVPGKRVCRRAPVEKKLLLVSANPIDTRPLQLDREIREIEAAILKARQGNAIKIHRLQGLRAADLKQALLDFRPTLVHFCGHGYPNGIALVGEDDKTQLVEFESLARLFGMFGGRIECVFLNACHTAGQSRCISKYIRKLVCMNGAIEDDTAIRFAADFYAGIGAGMNVDFSFRWARTSMAMDGAPCQDIPSLFTGRPLRHW